MVSLLALASLVPLSMGARLEVIVHDLALAGRLPANAVCSPAIADLPLSIVLQPAAQAGDLLAEAADAEWVSRGDRRVLERSPQRQLEVEARQAGYFLAACTRVVKERSEVLSRAEQNPTLYGKGIATQIAERHRTEGLSSVDYPGGLVAAGVLADLGAARASDLKPGEPRVFGNTPTGVQQPFGPMALRAMRVYEGVIKDTSVLMGFAREKPELASALQRLPGPSKLRFIVTVSRVRTRIALSVRTYDHDGRLLDTDGSSYLLITPPEPLHEWASTQFQPGPLSRELATRRSAPSGELSGELRELLLDVRRSPMLVLADEFAAGVAQAFPRKSVALVVDDGWFQTWFRLFGAKTVRLGTLAASIEALGGFHFDVLDDRVLGKPNLSIDAELNSAKPKALFTYLQAALVPGIELFPERCLLARELGLALLSGSAETLRVIARGANGPEDENLMFDPHALAAAAALFPLPTSEQPVRMARGTSAKDVVRLRQAMGGSYGDWSPQVALSPAILGNPSIYTDAELMRMPLELRRVPDTFYSLEDGLQNNMRRDAFEAIMLARPGARAEELREIKVLRALGFTYRLGVEVARGNVWVTEIYKHSGRPEPAVRLADLPEGEAMVQEALKQSRPPPSF